MKRAYYIIYTHEFGAEPEFYVDRDKAVLAARELKPMAAYRSIEVYVGSVNIDTVEVSIVRHITTKEFI